MQSASKKGATPQNTAFVEPFATCLERNGLSLVRFRTGALQINTGLLCNLRCRHCHLEAGPGRDEVMSRGTMEAVIAFAQRFPFQALDITGGAPEMVPDLPFLIGGLAPLAPRLMLRTNLTALASPDRQPLIDLCIAKRVVLIASFPSTSPSEMNSQRGAGVAETSIEVLRKLNSAGYGGKESGLELNVVVNPVEAVLPVAQAQVEREFRRDLFRNWGIVFNHLYAFGNAPLGRFREWLIESGNHDRYIRALSENFNPCTVDGLMCRTQLSVSWDGHLYDCDFNMAVEIPLERRKTHLSELRRLPPPGTKIEVGDHCYTCTATSGFT